MQHAADEYTRTTTKSVVRKYYEMRLKNSNDYQSRQQPPAVMQKELESKIFCLQMIIAENIRCMELLLKSSPQTHALPPAPGYDQMLTLAALRDSSSISAFMAASDTSTFSDVSDSVPIKPFHNCYKDKDTPPYSSASKPPPPPPPPPSDSKPDFKYDPEYALFLKWRQEHEIRSERKRGKQPTNDVELPDGTTNPEYSPCSDSSDDEHDSPPKPHSLPDSSSSSSSSSGSSGSANPHTPVHQHKGLMQSLMKAVDITPGVLTPGADLSHLANLLDPLLASPKYVKRNVTVEKTRVLNIHTNLQVHHTGPDIKAMFKNIFPNATWPPSQIPNDKTTRSPTYCAAMYIALKANEFYYFQNPEEKRIRKKRKK